MHAYIHTCLQKRVPLIPTGTSTEAGGRYKEPPVLCDSPFFSVATLLLVGKPEGKRPLGRPRRRWVDNFKMDLREIGWDGMDWIDQWRALANMVMNLWVP
jgi:hypothetical protein